MPGQSSYNFVYNNPVNLYDVAGLLTHDLQTLAEELYRPGDDAHTLAMRMLNYIEMSNYLDGGYSAANGAPTFGVGFSTIKGPMGGYWEWHKVEIKNYGDYDCAADPLCGGFEIYIESEAPGMWVWVEYTSDITQAGLYATTNLFSSITGIFGGLANAVENNKLAFAYKPFKFWPRNAEKYAKFLLKNLTKNSKAYEYATEQLNSFKTIAKFGPWLTIAATGMEISFANDTRAKWQAVGGAIGGYLGGTFGGYMVSHFLPGPGTIVGAIGGATAGNIIGRSVAGFLYDQLGPDIYKYYKP